MNTEHNVSKNKHYDRKDSVSIETTIDIDTSNQATYVIKSSTRNSNPFSSITANNLSFDNQQPDSGCGCDSADISYQASFPIFNFNIKSNGKECNNGDDQDNYEINEINKTISSKFYIGEEYDEDTCVSANITLHSPLAPSLDNFTSTTNYDYEFFDSSIREFLDKAKEEFKQKWDNPAQVSIIKSTIIITKL
uniref:SEA domain-containing protein n=1 Tax=Parastrongyloides trichosuri TaxID=131310 RepID=A0A0N5A3G2_PARTI